MPFTKSLRAKVLLSALVPIALVLVVVGVISLQAYEREAGKVVRQRDTELAQVSAARLFEGLARNRRILQSIADDEDLQSLEPPRMRRALDRTQSQLFVFDAGVVIYDAEGVATWSDPFSFRRRGMRFPAPSEFDKVSAALAPSLSNVFRDEISGEDVILLTVPIVARGPEFKGTVAGMSTLNSLLLNTTYSEVLKITEGSGRFAYVIDGNGLVIFHRDRSRLGTDLSTVMPVAQATEGETGAVIADGPEGETVISGFARVPDTDRAVITQERWSDVIGPIRGYSKLLLGLLVAGGVLSSALVLFAIGRILRPVKSLTEGAQRIAGGNFDQPIVTKTGDEIQELALQFNTMALSLNDSYAGLEGRVAERTDELRASEERYRTLFEESRDAIFVSSPDGKVVATNQAALGLFGFTLEEAIGSDVGDRFVDARDRDRFRHEMGQTGSVRDFEVKLLKGDGAEIDCLMTVTRRVDEDGLSLGVQGVIRDVTERNRAQRTLLEQTREVAVLEERNRMAREIHDTMAQGFTGIVLQLEAGEQALGETAGEVVGHLGRAKALARECLQAARRSVWNLLPRALEKQPIREALEEEVRQVRLGETREGLLRPFGRSSRADGRRSDCPTQDLPAGPDERN